MQHSAAIIRFSKCGIPCTGRYTCIKPVLMKRNKAFPPIPRPSKQGGKNLRFAQENQIRSACFAWLDFVYLRADRVQSPEQVSVLHLVDLGCFSGIAWPFERTRFETLK